MSNIFHLIIIVNHVDASVHQPQVSTELHVAGIQHIRQQRQIVLITVARHAVVLVGKFHALLLRAQVGKRREEIHVTLLHRMIGLLLCQLVRFLSLPHVEASRLQLPVVLEE